MAQVEISIPDLDQIRAALQPFVERALSVAEDAPRIIKDKAMLDNEDLNGQQMAQKKPRPKGNPQNFPNLPLIQDEDPDLMNNERWTVGEIEDDSRTITYNPPDHLQYLLEKDPDKGGRHWIGLDGTINPNARAEIEALMTQRIKESL